MIAHQRLVLAEELALLGLFDVGFQLHQTVLTGVGKHVIEHLQLLGVKGLVVGTALECAEGTLDDSNHDGQRIANQQCSDRGT